jgi:hypothetical protein
MKFTPILAAAFAACTSLAPVRAALFLVPEATLTAPALGPNQIVSFDEVPVNTAINGVTIDGYKFLENTPSASVFPANSGPGATNHVDGPLALEFSGAFNPATYVLTIELPVASQAFGFGFALLSGVQEASAVTVTLFDGLTNVGVIGIASTFDPLFPGGFAGIGSTVAFDRAEIRFSTSATSYALDNVASVAAALAVPEPGTALAGIALLGLIGGRRARKLTASI